MATNEEASTQTQTFTFTVDCYVRPEKTPHYMRSIENSMKSLTTPQEFTSEKLGKIVLNSYTMARRHTCLMTNGVDISLNVTTRNISDHSYCMDARDIFCTIMPAVYPKGGDDYEEFNLWIQNRDKYWAITSVLIHIVFTYT